MITALDLSAHHILQSYSLGSPAWTPECQTCQFLLLECDGSTWVIEMIYPGVMFGENEMGGKVVVKKMYSTSSI
ncbi:hypothetical protein Tco_0454771 [Tanacetum coccineum]